MPWAQPFNLSALTPHSPLAPHHVTGGHVEISMCLGNQVTWSTLLKGLFEEHVKKEIQVSQAVFNLPFGPISTLRAHYSINLAGQVSILQVF